MVFFQNYNFGWGGKKMKKVRLWKSNWRSSNLIYLPKFSNNIDLFSPIYSAQQTKVVFYFKDKEKRKGKKERIKKIQNRKVKTSPRNNRMYISPFSHSPVSAHFIWRYWQTVLSLAETFYCVFRFITLVYF